MVPCNRVASRHDMDNLRDLRNDTIGAIVPKTSAEEQPAAAADDEPMGVAVAEPEARFRLTGLTMTVANPKYEALLVKQRLLQADVRLANYGLRQARTLWASLDVAARQFVPPIDPALQQTVEHSGQTMFELFNDGSWLAVPEAIADDINQFYSNLVYNQVVRPGVLGADASEATKKQAIAAYASVLGRGDFRYVGLTVSLLRVMFRAWLRDLLREDTFDADDDETERRVYRQRVAELYATNHAGDMQTWTDEYLAAVTGPNGARARETVVALLTTARQQEQRVQAVALPDDAFDEAFEKARTTISETVSLGPQVLTEGNIVSQLEHLVMKMQAKHLYTYAAVREKSLEQQLDTVAAGTATIEVPLVIRWRLGSSEPAPKLSAVVVPTRTVNAEPVTQPGQEWRFEWYRDDVLVGEGESSGGGGNEYVLQRNDLTRSASYSVIARRFVNGEEVDVVVNDADARVIVYGFCLRCRTVYDADAPREFGECMWRAHPISPELIEKLRAPNPDTGRSVVGEAGNMAAGLVDMRAELDDSIIDAGGRLVLSDEQLLLLGGRGLGKLRATYFTYEAVLANIMNRAEASIQAMYGSAEAVANLAVPDAFGMLTVGESILLSIVRASVEPVTEAQRLMSLAAAGGNAMYKRDVDAVVKDTTAARRAFVEQFFNDVTGGSGSSDDDVAAAVADQAYEKMRLVVLGTDTVGELPVIAVLFATVASPLGNVLRKAVVKRSELRFLRELARRVSQFYLVYAEYDALAPGLSLQRSVSVDDGSAGVRTVFFGSIGSSVMAGPISAAVRMQSRWRSALRIVTMTPSQIAGNAVWKYARTSNDGLLPSDASYFFLDTDGEKRLQQRIKRANETTSLFGVTAISRDSLLTKATGGGASRALIAATQQEAMELRLREAIALHAPLHVPLEVWRSMDVSADGIAASAMAAGSVYHHVKDTTKDWRDVHSPVTNQPGLYEVSFEPVLQLGDEDEDEAGAGNLLAEIQQRGSQRLRTGYNFAAMHAEIERACIEYNVGSASEDADPGQLEPLKRRIQHMVDEYNVLAFFGPSRPRRAAAAANPAAGVYPVV